MGWTSLVLAITAGVAPCGCGPDAEPVDGIDDAFEDGKQDAWGIVEGSDEACAILRAANEASLAELDDEAGLDSRAAVAIVERRPFTTLEALDTAPYVGAIAAAALLEFAQARGLVCTGGEPECAATGGSYDGVAFTAEEECRAVRFMNDARFSEMGTLSGVGRETIYAMCPVESRPCFPASLARVSNGGPWRSVRQLSDHPGIGRTSIQQLRDAALAWTQNGLRYDTVASTWENRAALDGAPVLLERVYANERSLYDQADGWHFECARLRDFPGAPNYIDACVRSIPADSASWCNGDASRCADDMVGRWVRVEGVLHGRRLHVVSSGPGDGNPLLASAGEDPGCVSGWCTMPSPEGQTGYYGHATAWTGQEMIVWGGMPSGGSVDGRYSNEGRRFDPATGAWRSTALAGAPQGRAWAASAWTGTELILWGGVDGDAGREVAVTTGGVYDPAADRWRTMSVAGAPAPRYRPVAVWTGREMIVWGGRTVEGATLDSGAIYDPAADRWLPITTDGAPSARWLAAAAWTGDELVVWGGVSIGADGAETYLGDGAAYDPQNDTWRALATTGAPGPRHSMATAWTGTELILWGGRRPVAPEPENAWTADLYLHEGFAYDPAADRWRRLADEASELHWPAFENATYGTADAAAAWTGREVVFFGGRGGADEGHPWIESLSPGLAYDPAADSWRRLPMDFRPAPRLGASLAWTGDRLVVWGGSHAVPGSGAQLALE